MTEKKSPSAIVLPFGKHKGATVAELLTKDPAYAEWVANQGWVAERFAELHAAIISRGAVTDDSPEHNAIQVRFLDETFRVACLMAANIDLKKAKEIEAGRLADIYKSRLEYIPAEIARNEERIRAGSRYSESYQSDIDKMRVEETSLRDNLENKGGMLGPFLRTVVRFEVRGIDVVIGWDVLFAGESHSNRTNHSIEIKPSMGDDFPSVMRQMERLSSDILVVGEYTGRAVSEPQLRQMFGANRKSLVFVRDIEAEIANARAELA